jgi:hypothetical protein
VKRTKAAVKRFDSDYLVLMTGTDYLPFKHLREGNFGISGKKLSNKKWLLYYY